MFARWPYGTVISFLLFASAVAIQIFCLVDITNVYALFAYGMLKRTTLWLEDVKIAAICFYAYTLLLMFYNLLVAFRLTGTVSGRRRNSAHRIYCLDSLLVQRILFVVNHLTMLAITLVSLTVILNVFIVWILTRLCTDGSNVMKTLPLNPTQTQQNPGELGQVLDLREFAPIIGLRHNETQFLYFQNDRLKMFCDDYVSIAYLYSIIMAAAASVAIYAAFLLNVIFNGDLSKHATKKKMHEIYFLNEMSLLKQQNDNM